MLNPDCRNDSITFRRSSRLVYCLVGTSRHSSLLFICAAYPLRAVSTRLCPDYRLHLKGGRGAYYRSVRGRRVPLAKPVREAIREHLARIGTDNPDRALFSTTCAKGEPMDRSAVFRVLTEACRLRDRYDSHFDTQPQEDVRRPDLQGLKPRPDRHPADCRAHEPRHDRPLSRNRLRPARPPHARRRRLKPPSPKTHHDGRNGAFPELQPTLSTYLTNISRRKADPGHLFEDF